MKIIVCAPGKSYSRHFLKNWTAFISRVLQDGRFELTLSQEYSPNIYYARNLCMGGDIRRGRDQKPFNDKIEYDYILWIDSDILFTYDDFIKLFNHNVDICAGYYNMEDGQVATVKTWDTSMLEKKGSLDFCQNYEMICQSLKENSLMEVAYTGMGFMLIKKGVFEKLPYPWYKPLNIDVGMIHDFSTEDVSFCHSVQQHGFKVFVDTLVKVGHEKKFII